MKVWLPLLLLVTGNALAWGRLGHRMVGSLAEKRLTPVAQAKIKAILGRDGLTDVANWADDIRSDPHWHVADPWHYVTIEDGQSYDVRRASRNGNVITAIEKFTAQLSNPQSSPQQKREALSFLVHFVADVHQPLHVGRGTDRGGNDIKLKWFGRDTNLHAIWDESLLEMERLSFSEYVRFIDRATEQQKQAWSRTPLFGWADESLKFRTEVYDFPKKPASGWEYDYRHRMLPILNERMQQAGVRLATLLNGVLRTPARPQSGR